MIDESAAERVKALVDDALGHGAALLCGGEPQGAFFPRRCSTKFRVKCASSTKSRLGRS